MGANAVKGKTLSTDTKDKLVEESEKLDKQNQNKSEMEDTTQSALEIQSLSDLLNIIYDLRLKALAEIIKSGGVEEVLKFIDDNKIEINDAQGELKLTPIHIAAHLGSTDVLQALLTFPDADLNVQDKDGDTPLMLAIYGAQSDAKAVMVTGILMADDRCQIAKRNHNGVFPLCIAVKRCYKETTNLLLTKKRVKAYKTEDLVLVIKLAMMLEVEGMVDFIIERLDKTVGLDIICLLTGDPNLEAIRTSFAQLMSSTDSNKSSVSEEDKAVSDSLGHMLRIGNSVQILDLQTLRKVNPQDNVGFLSRIANNKAIVQEISGNRLVIKVTDDKVLAKINATGVIYIDDGPQQQIADGSNVRIGYYVRVFSDDETVKELSIGHGGWNDEMIKACGKTGKVLDIDKDSDALIGFAWGKAFFFNPKSLLPSSQESVETFDSADNVLAKGSPARLIGTASEFLNLQKSNNLSVDERHKGLLGKLVTVQRAIITPYSKDTDVIVVNNHQAFGVNAKCLTLVSSAIDKFGREIKKGTQVRVIRKKEEMMSLQTKEFGNWHEGMENVLGEIGHVIKFEVNSKFDPTDVVVQVKFTKPKSMAYYLHPKALFCQDTDEMYGSSMSESGTITEVIGMLASFDISTSDSDQPNLAESLNLLSTLKPENSPEPSQNGQDLDIQIIDRQQLISTTGIGQGSFGCVTKGFWCGTECAIKQIKAIVTSESSKKQIMKEANIHYKLKHPNIVQLYGISYTNDLWMVMQYVQGLDLHKVIFPGENEAIKKLTFPEKVKVALQISNGISYIHDLKLIHGDIKPQNMILDSNMRIFICDFGISRYLGTMDICTYATAYTSNYKGTLYYLAPECLKKHSQNTGYSVPTYKADVWAIGAVLFELFTSKHLFPDLQSMFMFKFGDMRSEDLAKRIKNELKAVDNSVVALSIIEKALEDEKHLRPTASEINLHFLKDSELSAE